MRPHEHDPYRVLLHNNNSNCYVRGDRDVSAERRVCVWGGKRLGVEWTDPKRVTSVYIEWNVFERVTIILSGKSINCLDTYARDAFTNNNSLSDNIDTSAMSHRHYQVISSINDYGRCTFEVLALYVRLGSNSTACTNVNISEIFETRYRNHVLISSRYRHFSTLLVETGEGICFFQTRKYLSRKENIQKTRITFWKI